MQGGDEDAIIQRWKELADADQKRRNEHGVLALIYAEAAGSGAVWRKALEGWNVIQSKQVLEWQNMAKVQDRTELVLTVLEEKFGPPPQELTGAIKASADLAALGRWIRLAAKANTLDDFRRDAGL